MKNRIAIWAIVGFLVAGCWAIYAMVSRPPALTHGDPMLILAKITCPISFLSHHPISLVWVLLANAATYALVGFLIETIRQKQHRLKSAH